MGPKMFFLVFAALASSAFAMSCPGCRVDQNTEEPRLHQLLLKGLSKYGSQPEGTDGETVQVHKVVRITSQVVAGVRYDYDFEGVGSRSGKEYSCHLVLLSRPWEEAQAVVEDFHCQPVEQRNKRALPGGEFEIDLKATGELPKYEEIISERMTKYVNTRNAFRIAQVLKATRQVVAGFMTRLEVELAETDCISGSGISLQKCSLKPKNHQVCNVAVWEKPWLNEVEVTELSCKKKQECFGCLSNLAANDDKANQVLKRTLANINAHSDKVWDLHKIDSIQFGVAAGLKYVYKFEAADETSTLHNCEAAVLNQPWLSPEPALLQFQCLPKAH